MAGLMAQEGAGSQGGQRESRNWEAGELGPRAGREGGSAAHEERRRPGGVGLAQRLDLRGQGSGRRRTAAGGRPGDKAKSQRTGHSAGTLPPRRAADSACSSGPSRTPRPGPASLSLPPRALTPLRPVCGVNSGQLHSPDRREHRQDPD